MIGPSSFSLPPDLFDVKNNNDGDGNIIGNNVNAGGRQQQSGQEAGGHSTHHVNDNDVLFDEFGRIIIEDYDGL